MRVVGRDGWRRSSAASSERTESSNVEREAFVDRQEKSGEEIGNDAVAKAGESVRTAAPQSGSKEPPEGMLVVRRISGRVRKKGGKVACWCENGSTGESYKLCATKKAVLDKSNSVKRELKKMKEFY